MRLDTAFIIDPMARRKKNRHGDGGYRQRGRYSWELRWMAGGAAHSETVRGSEADARAQLKRRTADAAEGAVAGGLMQRTVGDVLRWRLEHYERERPASLKTIHSFMARILADDLAAVRAVKLRKVDIEKFRDRLLQGGLAPASVNRHLEVVRAAFRLAAAEDPPLVLRVPRIEMLKEINIRQGFLPAEQYDRLMEHIRPDWMKLMFSIGYHVGARAGSILAAKWEQVDWEKKVIRPPANQPRNKKVGFWPIYGDLEKRLRKAEFRHQKYWPRVPWILHRDGRRLKGSDDYRRHWTKAVRLAGLDGLLFHDLRRTAARNLLTSGIEPMTVCRIVGWETSAMLHRYRIVDEIDVARAGEKAEKYLESLDRGPEPKEKAQ